MVIFIIYRVCTEIDIHDISIASFLVWDTEQTGQSTSIDYLKKVYIYIWKGDCMFVYFERLGWIVLIDSMGLNVLLIQGL